MAKSIKIVEVGPRDGLQNEQKVIDTQVKVEFIESLIAAGHREIEITSFVRPEKIPQLKDAAEVCLPLLGNHPDVTFSALVPNIQGFNKAIECGVKKIAVFTSVSESFNKKNVNASIEQSLEKIERVCEEAIKKNIEIRGYISTAFGCPYEGKFEGMFDKVCSVSERLFKLGVSEVSIGDTLGVGNPLEVIELVKMLSGVKPLNQFALHLHDTFGRGLSNVVAGYQSGIEIFDSSAGGLGGCPYADGAAGNIATEDLVSCFHDMEIETGINLEKQVASSKQIFGHLGKVSYSKVNMAMEKKCLAK